MIENVLVKLGILTDHTPEEYSRVELFVEDAERAIKIAIRKPSIPKELEWICEEMAIVRYRKFGSEAAKSESVDGYSVTFVDDMIAPYKSILDDYVASTGRKLRTL